MHSRKRSKKPQLSNLKQVNKSKRKVMIARRQLSRRKKWQKSSKRSRNRKSAIMHNTNDYDPCLYISFSHHYNALFQPTLLFQHNQPLFHCILLPNFRKLFLSFLSKNQAAAHSPLPVNIRPPNPYPSPFLFLSIHRAPAYSFLSVSHSLI